MATRSHDATGDAVAEFGQKLSAWSATLDDNQKAMLIDLLAKAGGDVYGHDETSRFITPDGGETDASNVSPLEWEDYAHAVLGIVRATQEGSVAVNQEVRAKAGKPPA
jgi:hypothetical protein